MRLNINYKSTYHFNEPVRYGLQQVRLTPKSRTEQEVIDWAVRIDQGQVETEFLQLHHFH